MPCKRPEPAECARDTCEEFARARGLCSVHYNYAQYRGMLDEWGLPPKSNKRAEGSRVVTEQGYITVSHGGKTHQEHRWVMSQHLGRPLLTEENIHHINGDRSDNRIENLEMWFRPQPGGQRLDQLLDYVAQNHAEEILSRISG